MAREFCVVDDTSIKFGEDFIHWHITQKEMFDIRVGRNLVVFNEINVRILDLLYDYDLTEEEHNIIHRALWLYLFRVKK